MRSISILATALLASIPATLAQDTTPTAATTTYTKGVEEPSASPTLDVPVVQGCYSHQGELVKAPKLEFNSKDSCAKVYCKGLGKMVAGTMGGNMCYCGDKYPPKAALADDSQCNIGCTGYDKQACGGFNSTTNTYYWTIYNTGVSLAVLSSPDDILPQSSSTSSKTSTQTAEPTVTVSAKPGQTTPATTPDSESNSSGKSNNTVGIAVGVVVGIVALAAIIGGLFFYMRRKRSREMDEKNHRDAVINNFFGAKPGSSGGYSVSDARLDPVMAHRRDSIGSIADNQDYSRKILRVTNA